MHQIFTQHCILYILTMGCALQTLAEILIFSIFCAKKLEICSKILQKTRFFKFAQNAGWLFYSPKNQKLQAKIINNKNYGTFKYHTHILGPSYAIQIGHVFFFQFYKKTKNNGYKYTIYVVPKRFKTLFSLKYFWILCPVRKLQLY